MMKTILDYMNECECGVIVKPLGTITPQKAREKAIVKLHNIVHSLFYNTDSALELRIDFDPKKINVDAMEDVHRLVRVILDDYQKHFEYIVMREWGTKGGRLHYHGLIKQTSGGQTQLAKLKSTIKRVFGRRSDIKHITFPDSYIPYMFKRTLQENNILMKEWFSTMLIKTVYMRDEYEPLEYYNIASLKMYNEKRILKRV